MSSRPIRPRNRGSWARRGGGGQVPDDRTDRLILDTERRQASSDNILSGARGMSDHATPRHSTFVLTMLLAMIGGPVAAQPYGRPDAGSPGDAMIQAYLRAETEKIESGIAGDVKSLEAWQQRRERYQREYFHMLGLWPLPEKTPLEATVTGTLDRGDYLVDTLHFQSRPGAVCDGQSVSPGASCPRRPLDIHLGKSAGRLVQRGRCGARR